MVFKEFFRSVRKKLENLLESTIKEVNNLYSTNQMIYFSNFKGNEAHINLFTSELANFLTSHHLLEQNNSLANCEELNEVLFFLAINTNFKRELPDSDQYSHLIGIVPKLSKCLLANTCFNLNLIKNYGWLIEKLPLELTEELLDQAIDCMKHMKSRKLLSCSAIIIAAVIKKLSMTELSNKVFTLSVLLLH